MSELRRDPILRRWVIISPEQSPRPAPHRVERPVADDSPCPFCPGNEHLNPEEIATVGDGDSWSVRVTPDSNPLLRIEGDLGRRGAGMFDVMNAIGAHELVTDTPAHDETWPDFSIPHMVRLLETYRARTADLRRDGRFRHVVILKNHGAVWSRYSHSHSHVVATPFTPKRIEEELRGAREYFRMKERCVFCDQLSEEVRAGTRLVTRNQDFATFAPFASEYPYETWIVPLRHAAEFGPPSGKTLEPLAELVVDALARLRSVLGDSPFSVAVHAGPLDGSDQAEFHWHVEIVPHVPHELGMEWATGILSNPVPPEDAARLLREAGGETARR